MVRKYSCSASHHGHGVIATDSLMAGESILYFSGRRISAQLAESTPYALQVSETEFIEVLGTEKYVNHHCEPNCGIRRGNELVALRNIKSGEEITFDYSTCMLEGHGWTMPCECLSPNCRKYIGDFDTLPLHLQLFYWSQGLVTDFITRQCGEFLNQLQGQKLPASSPTQKQRIPVGLSNSL